MPEGNGDYSFRLQGELERKHPDVEPLPPTPITPDAKARLEKWGVQEPFIRRLSELSSSMRYDLSSRKAERIAQTGGYIYAAEDGTQEVVLPDFRSLRERLDGACDDIGIQFLTLLHSTDYLKELNADLARKGKPHIQPAFITGLSRTHFNQPGTSHTWVGLLPEGAARKDLLMVDPSFQEISNLDTNGYIPQSIAVDPPEFTNWHTSLSIPVGKTKRWPREGQPVIKMPAVIGLSSDKELVYSLGFFKDNTRSIRPVISARPSEMSSTDPICYANSDGTIKFSNDGRLTDQQKAEMQNMIGRLNNMNLIKDTAQAEKLKNQTITIYLE